MRTIIPTTCATRPKPCPAVRGMSALSEKFQGVFTTMRHEKYNKHAAFRVVLSSPKAEVTSSNLVGRAKISDISELAQSAIGCGNTIADTASHLCRDENEVREKMKKLGMVENPGRRGSAR